MWDYPSKRLFYEKSSKILASFGNTSYICSGKMEKKKYKYQTQIDELTALDCIVRRELR